MSSLYSEPQTEQDKAKIVQELLNHDADINALDSRGKTPLHLAVSAKTTEVVKVLLKRGADPDITDEKVHEGPSKDPWGFFSFPQIRFDVNICINVFYHFF